LLLPLAGCGGGEHRVETVIVTTAPTRDEAVVHIYFCTADTCAREATRAQMHAVRRRASESPLVKRMIFVSKEDALSLLRKKHPVETANLPSNPFPNALTIIPIHAEDVTQIAALFVADSARGIDKVDHSR
jgi:cell division protein FtsX